MADTTINLPDEYSNGFDWVALPNVYGGLGVDAQGNSIVYTIPAVEGHGVIFSGRINYAITSPLGKDYDTFKVTLDPGLYELVREDVDGGVPTVGALIWNANGTKYTQGGFLLYKDGESPTYPKTIEVTTTTTFYIDIFSSCCYCTGNYAFSIKNATALTYVDPVDVPGDLHVKNATVTNPEIKVGESLVGDIGIYIDVDAYKVHLEKGKTYVFAAESYLEPGASLYTRLWDPALVLYKPNGSEITYTVVENFKSYNDYVEYTATETGDFYLSVKVGTEGKTYYDNGAYKLTAVEKKATDDYSSSLNSGASLLLNGSRSGEIESPTDSGDAFKVNLLGGVTYVLRIERNVGSYLDPVLKLYGLNQAKVAENDNKGTDPLGNGNFSASSLDSLIVFTPEASGTYYLKAGGDGVTMGSYTISATVLDDALSTNQTIQRVAVNHAPVTGQIEMAGDADWYGIYLSAGATYEFKAAQADVYALSNPLLSLRDRAGLVIASNDDSVGLDSVVRFTATASGMYFLDVRDSADGTGRYLLSASAQDDFSATISTKGVVDMETTTGGAGRIEFGGDVDWLQIDLERGSDYVIRVQGSASGGGLTLADPRLHGVYDSEGVLVHNSGNDDYGDTRDAYVRFTPDQTGRYYLAIAGSTLDDIGSYRITVERETFNDIAGSTATRSVLAVGETVTSTIDQNADTDWYSVKLLAGQTYVIDLMGDLTSTQVLRDPVFGGIYNASGTLLANTTNNNYGASLNSRMLFTPTESGTYFLEAKGNQIYTGNYQLSIKNLFQINDAVGDTLDRHAVLWLDNGKGVVNGSVDVARDVDWYAVQLNADTMYDITLRGAASGMGSLLDPRLWGIYDATGKMLLGTGSDSGDGGTDVRTNFVAPTSGIYYLAAGGTADMTGTYRLEVRPTGLTDDVAGNVSTTATMKSGGVYYGQIETIGDKDWIRVDLAANTKVNIEMNAYTASLGSVSMPDVANVFKASGEAVHLDLYKPSASRRNTTSIREFVSDEAGTYYIELKSLNEGIGGYSLKVTESAIGDTEQSTVPDKMPTNPAPELLGSYIDHDATTRDLLYSSSMPVDGVLTLKFGRPNTDWTLGGSDTHEGWLDTQIFKGMGKIYIAGNGQSLAIDVNSDQVTVYGNTVTINPDVDFLPNTDYNVVIEPGTFVDVTGTSFTGIGVERKTTYFGGVKGYYSDLPNTTIFTWKTETINDPDEFIFKTAPLSDTDTRDSWTLMVYMAADNELEGQALTDLKEMFAAQLPSNVNVVVMVDRAAGYDVSGGNWTEAFMGQIQGGMRVEDIPTQWTSMGEVNMGSAATLQSFITTTQQSHAADHYGLFVWGPGGGISGTAWDYSAGLDNLSLTELSSAMTDAGLTAKVTGIPSDQPSLRLLNANLAGDGSQVVLTYNKPIYDMMERGSPAEVMGSQQGFSNAFQYSLDNGSTWHSAVGWSVGYRAAEWSTSVELTSSSAVTVDLGVSVNSGQTIIFKYDAGYRPSGESYSAIESATSTTQAGSFEVTITDDRLDLVAFDSSLMGLAETLWEVKGNTHWMVASEDIIPSTGLDYVSVLDALANNPEMSTSNLASNVVLSYAAQNAGGISASMAAYDIDAMTANQNGAGLPALFSALNEFAAAALKDGTVEHWKVIHDAAVNIITAPTHDAQVDYLRDLSDFLSYLWVYLPSGSIWQKEWIASLAVEKVATFARTVDSGSVGLGIYMPLGMPVDPTYTGGQNGNGLAFLNTAYGKDSQGNSLYPQWDEFIQRLQADLVNKAPSNLAITAEVTGAASGHLAEITSKASAYKLSTDLRVATVSYTDDVWTNTNQFTLTGLDASKFKVVEDGLYLRKGTLIDYEAVTGIANHFEVVNGMKVAFYEVTVNLADATIPDSTTSATYRVYVDNVDEAAPKITSDASARVAENIPTSTVVYQVQATDDIGVARYSFKAEGEDYKAFNIDAAGAVRFSSSPNYEEKGVYNFTVVAEDAVGYRAEKAVRLVVSNVTEAGEVDNRAPSVLEFKPADNTSRVALNSNIVLSFDEAVQFRSGKVAIKTVSGTTVDEFDAVSTDSGFTLTMDPNVQLANNTMYRLDFSGATIEDMSGNKFAPTETYNFRTINGIDGITTSSSDTTAPTLTAAQASGALGLADNLVLNFSEAIQRGAGQIRIKSGEVVLETIDVASSTRILIENIPGTTPKYTLTIDPAISLKINTAYEVVFDQGALLDAAGNGLAAGTAYSVQTAAKGDYDIDWGYTAGANQWTAEQKGMFKEAFDTAVDVWEGVIVGDVADVRLADGTLIDDILIHVNSEDMDGDVLATGGFSAMRDAADHNLPYIGEVNIEIGVLATLTPDQRILVLAHEIGHALGFGTLWGIDGLNSVKGQYTGEYAVKVYQEMMNDPSLTGIPLEVNACTGETGVHWPEDRFDEEFLTTAMSNHDGFPVVSKLSVAGMQDLGYDVNYNSAYVSTSYRIASAPVVDVPQVDVAYTGLANLGLGYMVV